MSLNYINKNLVQIEAFNMFEFVQNLEEAVLKGYRVSNENDYYPHHSLGHWTMKLVADPKEVTPPAFQDLIDKTTQEEDKNENTNVPVQSTVKDAPAVNKTPKKRGRKPSGNKV